MKHDKRDNPNFWGRSFRKEAWPEVGGEVGKKFFHFGEKAVFVENWPLGRIQPSLFSKQTQYRVGEEYPTLGSTEVKVLLINKKGELDLIPFFAVQNTGKVAFWFSLKWWLKIWLDKHNIRQSTGRFASNFNHYKPAKSDSSATRGFYIGELLEFTQDYPPLDGAIQSYKKGEVRATLGIYQGIRDTIPYFENMQFSMRSQTTKPGALIVDPLGRLDLIPLDFVKSTGKYNIFFVVEYYAKILWSRLKKKKK